MDLASSRLMLPSCSTPLPEPATGFGQTVPATPQILPPEVVDSIMVGMHVSGYEAKQDHLT